MENQQYTKETLLTALDTLTSQNNEFFERLVQRILISGKTIYFGNEPVYLAYFGKDEDVIFKLFNIFINLKYPGYNVTETQPKLLKKLIKIITDKTSKPGVILQGPVGSGKTTLFLVWLEFRNLILGPQKVDRTNYNDFKYITYPSFITYTPVDVRNRFMKDEFEFLESSGGSANAKNGGEIMFIDDFGLNATARHYGENINLLEEIVYRRYEEFKRATNFELYVTTNFTKKEIKGNFNARVYSRLTEMASWEVLVDDDHRLNDVTVLKQWPNLPSSTNSYFPSW